MLLTMISSCSQLHTTLLFKQLDDALGHLDHVEAMVV
jgi:hypothetical protein